MLSTRQSSLMFVFRRHVNALKTQRLTSTASVTTRLSLSPLNHQAWQRLLTTTPRWSVKSVSKKKVKDLAQGVLKGEVLPPADKEDLRKESLHQVIRKWARKFPDCVMLTKVGNFYELYFEQATMYAPLLNIKLAQRRDGVPMAGFPLAGLNRALKSLVLDLDKHVAIIQEYPEYVNGKLQTPISRRVERVVTPGTFIDEDFIDQSKNNFLLSIHCADEHDTGTGGRSAAAKEMPKNIGLAWIDISTGDFFLQSVDRGMLSSALMRIGASEAVVSETVSAGMREEIAASLGLKTEMLVSSEATLTGDNDDSWNNRLDKPLAEEELTSIPAQEAIAIQHLFNYIDKHLLEVKFKPSRPQTKEQDTTMAIDKSSVRGLELLKTVRDGLGKGSLLNIIDRTVTKGGTRLLRERLLYPSIISAEIEYRLDLVSAFLQQQELHQDIVVRLRDLYDVHRLAQKFALNRGDAEELLCLARTFSRIKDIVSLLGPHSIDPSQHGLAIKRLLARLALEGPEQLVDRIQNAVDEEGLIRTLTHDQSELEEASEINDGDAEELPMLSKKSRKSTEVQASERSDTELWIMQKNATPQLQQLHDRLQSLHTERAQLEASLRERLMSSKLTLRTDSKYGHICHIPNDRKLRGQDLKTQEEALEEVCAVRTRTRYTTSKSYYLPTWSNLGGQMTSLIYEIRQEEQCIFQDLRQLVVDNLVPLRQNAAVMDELDLATSFATLAINEGWNRPRVTTQPTHKIVGGRHPTVKFGLAEKGRTFVSNDLFLDRKAHAWLITGPNMAGKSTFLRQNALITILAQVGCYVPAEYAAIGIVDRMFSRIGAADDLFRNESTFMVEMLETASILRDATERSFVIMDEVGRGTAPEDGTAVAYAALHHLYHVNKCRTLFATHFHELAEKTEGWKGLARYCTDLVEDQDGSFIFVHKLRGGVNRKSHALKVARMAGLPSGAIEVAQGYLIELNQKGDQALSEPKPSAADEAEPLKASAG